MDKTWTLMSHDHVLKIAISFFKILDSWCQWSKECTQTRSKRWRCAIHYQLWNQRRHKWSWGFLHNSVWYKRRQKQSSGGGRGRSSLHNRVHFCARQHQGSRGAIHNRIHFHTRHGGQKGSRDALHHRIYFHTRLGGPRHKGSWWGALYNRIHFCTRYEKHKGCGGVLHNAIWRQKGFLHNPIWNQRKQK